MLVPACYGVERLYGDTTEIFCKLSICEMVSPDFSRRKNWLKFGKIHGSLLFMHSLIFFIPLCVDKIISSGIGVNLEVGTVSKVLFLVSLWFVFHLKLVVLLLSGTIHCFISFSDI